jgi:4-diphosphocytidyl-2-C-methyl-D-erythritol kinase
MSLSLQTMDWSRGWPAPAKLNLLLRILNRRPDGYHNLQTVFQFVQQADVLDFRLRTDGRIRRMNALLGVAEADDLTVRAAFLLQAETGCAYGVDIRLNKQLPLGAGLGGGSSDAATVLVALNHLWGCGLSRADLAALGVQLGADVPVFVQSEAAWAEGIGECLQPLVLPEPYYVVLIPACQVSTAKIFSDQQLTRASSAITIDDFMTGCHENHCLPVVLKHFPPVAEAFAWLEQFASARLTGTGACVFAEFSELVAAEQVMQQIPANCRGFISKGLNQSPLYQRFLSELSLAG